jgi:type II secretory pathway component PulK
MTTMYRQCSVGIRKNDGVALLTVLAMMLIFVMLGTAYVRYMSIEVDKARYELLDVRSQNLASGGIHAVIGEVNKVMESGGAIRSEYTFPLPVYRFEGGERVEYPQTVRVRLADESGRVNLNYATPELLMALGMTEANIAALKRSVSGNGKHPRWLVSVDELRTRNIMDGQEFGGLNKDLFTVFTAENPDDPKGYININSASVEVLSALFNIDAAEAQTLAAKRPFQSWEEAVTKLGREPSTFNTSNREYGGRTMPSELSLDTHCYRIISEVAMVVEPSTSSKGLHRAVEAVVLFDDDGNDTVRYWNEHPGDAVYAAKPLNASEDASASGEVSGSPAAE